MNIPIHLTEDGAHVTGIQAGDAITARLVSRYEAVSNVVSVSLTAAGTDLTAGKIVVQFTQAESSMWRTGHCDLVVKRNGLTYRYKNMRVVKGYL